MKTIRRTLLLALLSIAVTACGSSSILGPESIPDSGSLSIPDSGSFSIPDSGS